MKIHPFALLFLVIVLVGGSVLLVSHTIIRPLSSEYATLNEQLTQTNKKLNVMTEQYNNAKLLVQAEQDRIEVRCLIKYITEATTNISPADIEATANAIIKYSRKAGLPTELIVGIVRTESAFNPTALSHKGARGLMQVIHAWHKEVLAELEITRRDLHNPDKGIIAGVYVLSSYLSIEDGSLDGALHRYNGKNGKAGVYSSLVYGHTCRYALYRAKYYKDNDALLNTDNLVKDAQAAAVATAAVQATDKEVIE